MTRRGRRALALVVLAWVGACSACVGGLLPGSLWLWPAPDWLVLPACLLPALGVVAVVTFVHGVSAYLRGRVEQLVGRFQNGLDLVPVHAIDPTAGLLRRRSHPVA